MKATFAQLLLAAALAAVPSSARAISISGNELDSTSSLGDFTGTFEYTAANDTNATISVSLTNTSPVGSGFITAFVFNNPSDKITGVSSFTATDSSFELLGATSFSDSVNGAPFGQFDVGASTGSSFEGGGAPSNGLAVGASATFTFAVTGAGLSSLTAETFFSTLSEGTGAGEGYQPFVVRFRGFANGGSDKVPGTPGTPDQPVPEPASMLLLSGAVISGIAARRKRA